MNKIKFLKLVVVILIFSNLNAQDTIVKKDGTTINSKILEISTSEIKYKKSSNLMGPIYSLQKMEISRITFENGEIEVFEEDTNGSSKKVFVKKSSDSKVKPDDVLWAAEMDKYSQFKKVKNLVDAEFVFEFTIKRALGEARVKVKVYDAIGKNQLWESKKYRGTTNAFNGMSPTKHGIRRCFLKGILPAFEAGKF